MSTTYPGVKQSFTNPSASDTTNSPDHAGQHADANDTLESLQDVLGTTAGTSVLKDFSAGHFPARVNSGGTIVQTLTGGTINNSVVSNSTLSGTITAGEMGSAVVKRCMVKMTAVQSIANGADTKIAWDSEDSDPNNMHDNSTNPSRITVPDSGLYSVDTCIMWNTNATGGRYVSVWKNGAASIGGNSVPPTSAFETRQSFTKKIILAASDYLEINVYQSSGGTLGVSNADSFFHVTKLSN